MYGQPTSTAQRSTAQHDLLQGIDDSWRGVPLLLLRRLLLLLLPAAKVQPHPTVQQPQLPHGWGWGLPWVGPLLCCVLGNMG
jgi:hypothetical protein